MCDVAHSSNHPHLQLQSFLHAAQHCTGSSQYAAAPQNPLLLFPAIHFALYTHPKRIFLVGCDTVPTGYFDGTKHNGQMHNDIMLKGYRKLKEYISVFYPDIEIISINPVGLKGIFKDIEIGEK